MVISYSHQNRQRQVELEEITLKFDNVLSVENQIVFPFLFYFSIAILNLHQWLQRVITPCCCCCCCVASVVSDSVRPHGRQPMRLPSLGFSRQEHWSGLPLPSPMQESEKWKWSHSAVISDSSRPHGLQPTRFFCPWDIPGKSTGVGYHCLLQITPITSLFLFILRQSN